MAELPKPHPSTVNEIYAVLTAHNHMGDSLGVSIGQSTSECERQLWYKFRWACPPEQIDGQKARRFETGRAEEVRLLDDLGTIGVEVYRLDPITGKHCKVELADGWLRGKLDARALGVPESPDLLHVVECKSHNDKSFKSLLKHAPPKEGLKLAKLEHYAQCQLYMHALGIHRALYLAVNKNDDALYAEIVAYDSAFALVLENRVRRIVASNRAPSRLYDDSNSKAAFTCKWCPALAQCHEKAWARRNCRTCISSAFEKGAVVNCALHKKSLTYDEQQAGCDQHLYLPALVPGEQMDAGDRWVKYHMPDGKEWIDGEVKS